MNNKKPFMFSFDKIGSTDKDILFAKELRPALKSKEFNEIDKKEILKEIRYLEGYRLPNECVLLIKEYLLLPSNIYLSKKIFINHISKASLSILNNILYVHFHNKVMNLTDTSLPLNLRRNTMCKLLLNKIDSNLIIKDDMYSKLNALYFNSPASTRNSWINEYSINQEVFVNIHKPFKMCNKGIITHMSDHSITVALYTYINDNTLPENTITRLIWTANIRNSVVIKKSYNIMKIGDNKWLDKVFEDGLLIVG